MTMAVVETRTEETTVEHRFEDVADAVEFYRAHPEATRIWLDEPGWRIWPKVEREGERCRCRSARGCPGARRWRGRH